MSQYVRSLGYTAITLEQNWGLQCLLPSSMPRANSLRKVCLSFWHRGTNSGLPCGPCLPRKSHICVILPATKHGHQKQPALCPMHREQRNLCPPLQDSSSLSCRPRGGSFITPRVLGLVSEQRSPPELHRCSLATRRARLICSNSFR